MYDFWGFTILKILQVDTDNLINEIGFDVEQDNVGNLFTSQGKEFVNDDVSELDPQGSQVKQKVTEMDQNSSLEKGS